MESSNVSQTHGAQALQATASELVVAQSRKKFLINVVLIILIIIAAGVAVYVLFFKPKTNPVADTKPTVKEVVVTPIPTADPMANWKTYTNAKIGFEIKYPDNWYSEGSETSVELRKDPYPNTDTSEEYVRKLGYSVFVLEENLPTNISFDQWVNNTINEISTDTSSLTKSMERTSVNGLIGYRATRPEGLDGGRILTTFSLRDNKIIHVILAFNLWSLEEGKQRFPEAEKIYNQMLSTFKFTSQDSGSKAKGFPVYPGAAYVGEEKTLPCQPGWDKDITGCDGTTFTWKTPDDYDKVRAFYKSVNVQGWTCYAGGAGSYWSPRDASSISNCTLNYTVNYDAKSTGTSISVVIPDL